MGLSNPQGGYPSQGFGGKGPAQQAPTVAYNPANRATGAPAYLTPFVQGLLQPTGFGGKGPPQELPPQPRVAQQRQYRV